MISPLIKLESSEAKNKATFATSFGSPLRGLFVAPDITLSIPYSLDSPPAISVFTPPGAIALQRIPFVAYWKPTFLVKPTTACFAAVYATPAREPWSAAADAMLIMTPLSASRKTDKALRVDLIIDLVLIAKTLSHNSSVMSAAGVILSIMPALFTKISSFPYVLTA